MRFIAQEVREYLAELGFRSIEEAVGQTEVLDVDTAVHHWKTFGLDLRPIFHKPELPEGASRHCTTTQDHGLERALDNTLIQLSEGALQSGDKVRLDLPVRNVNRTVGTMLGYEVTKRWGADGLPTTPSTSRCAARRPELRGVPARGVTLRLVGDSNDYVGKGLSGGRITLRPDPDAPFVAEENVIAGNVLLYGATSGELFVRGVVGERFCVRNSGALAVVEGVGDHGCEYMTGASRSCSAASAATSRPACPAAWPTCSTPAPEPSWATDQPGDGRRRPARRGRLQRCFSTPSSATTRRLARRWPVGCSLTGTTPSSASRRSCRRTSNGSAGPRGGRGGDGRDPNQAIMEAAHG
jgi:glutamate synthase (NADPH/NADH) large chain